MSLIEKIEQQFNGVFQDRSARFLLAVSGGMDSMVLMQAMATLRVKFVVAHMNYGLRGADSDQDEVFVVTSAKQLGIEVHTLRVDAEAFCNEKGVAIQEGARMLRYGWFEELLERHDLKAIVTAHHEEDNKETFFQNLKRGSGLRGLKSMEVYANNRFKPMLFCSKELIVNYAAECNVDFRLDVSNNKNHYQRNLIRNEVLPFLEQSLPGVGHGISESILYLQNDYDFLKMQLDKESKGLLLETDQGKVIQDFRSVHSRVLLHIFEKFDFNHHQLNDLLSATKSGKHIRNEKYQIVIGGTDIYVDEVVLEEMSSMEISMPGTYGLPNEKLEIKEVEFPKAFSRQKTVVFVDADLLKWPLTLRTYQEGDRIRPLGMKGSKKLSDYFTDQKIPSHLRPLQMVLVSGSEIVWIVNEQVSDLFKLTDQTKKVFKIETFSKKDT